MKVKEWIKILEKSNPEESICIHMFGVDDVVQQGKEMDEKVTRKDAQLILEEIESNIDSESGVSWDNIRSGIEDFIKNKKKNK